MIDAERLSAFVIAATLVTLAPGPDILHVIARGMAHGRGAALAAALGFATGNLVHTLLAVAGLSAVIAASPVAFSCIHWAGAGYLAYLGVKMLSAGGGPSDSGPGSFRSPGAVFRQCVLANLLNPKVAIFFLALLPQFVDQTRDDAPWQFALLGGVFTLVVVVCFGATALASGYLGERLRRNETARRVLQSAAGLVLIGLAVHLVATGSGLSSE